MKAALQSTAPPTHCGADLVSADAIAKLLGVKPATVRLMFRKKRIPGFRFSKRVLLFNVAEVLNAVHQELAK